MTMFEIKQEAENLLTLAYNEGRRDGIEEAKRQQKALEKKASELEVGE